MRIIINTSVEQDFQTVWNGFDKQLFLRLSPPFPLINDLKFGGCNKNDVVEFDLNFLWTTKHWKSIITDQQISENEIYFIDLGVILPSFLKSWKHKHRVMKNGENCIIRDEIEFSTPTILTNYFFYPLLYLQFLYRKPIYKRTFRRKGKLNL